MKTFEITIQKLSELAAQKTLSIEAMDEWSSSQSSHIQLYLQTMKLAVKPEAATSDLFRNIIAQENVHLYPEMRQGERGNVDFVVQETRKNPVLICTHQCRRTRLNPNSCRIGSVDCQTL